MATLPQLIEEDIREIDGALNDLLAKSEATSSLVIDKGGFLITQCGDTRRFDTTTLGALAAAMYAATQGIASLVSEANFSSVYQQGENFSLLVHNVDEHCLLVVIFRAQIGDDWSNYFLFFWLLAVFGGQRGKLRRSALSVELDPTDPAKPRPGRHILWSGVEDVAPDGA